MAQSTLVLFAIASLIVIGLAGYAAVLLYKLYQQNQRHNAFLKQAEARQVEQIQQRNTNILESVVIIARAAKEGECELSEAAIRLYKLMEVLQGDAHIDFAATYPSLNELYQVVGEMARGDARQALEKRERMRQDVERMKAEARLQDAIMPEFDVILATYKD